ncbi:hypothetical protein BGZ80_004187 [Entomortierella chlamydospora]|uniref:Uncharacterized protein n=1 Tax=Entomortierella chlamydospora TaxID=101097 RepID=A0A9P6T2N8_9FUNG|nr:hypothetical protein BGZ80_004187 [Entomortierella chlamydospora]
MGYSDQHQGQHTAESFPPQPQNLSSHYYEYHSGHSSYNTNGSIVASASTAFSSNKILEDSDITYPTSGSTTETLYQPKEHTSTDSSPLIARVFIPKTHHTQFIEVLSSPPDPALKIKKSVRFNNMSLDPAVSTSKSSRSKTHVPSAADKDPEEKMAELMELKRMKIRQEDFLHMKDQILQITQTLEDKQSILDEVRSERKSLQSELARYIAMVKQIQKDFELTQQAEAELTKERDQLSQQLSQLKNHDFKIFKEEVDQMRMKKGLRPLPSLEQEEAEFMGRYLEQRREQWREDGMQDVVFSNGLYNDGGVGSSSSNRHGAATINSSLSSPSSSQRVSGSGSTKSLRTSTSSSSLVSASSSTAVFNGRDGGRSGKNRHTSSSHSRSNSSSRKSKYESPSRSGGSGHNSSSRSARQSRSRSQSPSQSSTSVNARAERLKKRSRY